MVNRFDKPVNIKFRDQESTYVPEEFVPTQVADPFVRIPLQELGQGYGKLQSLFDKSSSEIDTERQTIKNFGKDYVNLWGIDVPLNHKEKVAKINQAYRDQLTELSAKLDKGDMDALNKIKGLASNYANNPYLNYVRSVEDKINVYEEEITKAKMAGDRHRANSIYNDLQRLVQSKNQEGDLTGTGIVEEQVPRHERLNTIFSGLTPDQVANIEPYSLGLGDLGFLNTTQKYVTNNDVGTIFDLAVKNDPQLFNDLKQEGLAYASRLSLLGDDVIKADPNAVLNDDGSLNFYATANNHINDTYTQLRDSEIIKRGFNQTDKSVTNHNWFYDVDKKDKSLGLGQKIRDNVETTFTSDGALENIGGVVDSDGKFNLAKAQSKITDINNQLSTLKLNPNDPQDIQNTVKAKIARLEADKKYLQSTMETSFDYMDDAVINDILNSIEVERQDKKRFGFNTSSQEAIQGWSAASQEISYEQSHNGQAAAFYAIKTKEDLKKYMIDYVLPTMNNYDGSTPFGDWISGQFGNEDNTTLDHTYKNGRFSYAVPNRMSIDGLSMLMMDEINHNSDKVYKNNMTTEVISLSAMKGSKDKYGSMKNLMTAMLNNSQVGNWSIVNTQGDASKESLQDLLANGYQIDYDQSSFLLRRGGSEGGLVVNLKDEDGNSVKKYLVPTDPTLAKKTARDIGEHMANNPRSSNTPMYSNDQQQFGIEVLKNQRFSDQINNLIPDNNSYYSISSPERVGHVIANVRAIQTGVGDGYRVKLPNSNTELSKTFNRKELNNYLYDIENYSNQLSYVNDASNVDGSLDNSATTIFHRDSQNTPLVKVARFGNSYYLFHLDGEEINGGSPVSEEEVYNTLNQIQEIYDGKR